MALYISRTLLPASSSFCFSADSLLRDCSTEKTITRETWSHMNAVCKSKEMPGSNLKFNITLYALSFIVFDVEVILIFPWARVFQELGPVALSGNGYLSC